MYSAARRGPGAAAAGGDAGTRRRPGRLWARTQRSRGSGPASGPAHGGLAQQRRSGARPGKADALLLGPPRGRRPGRGIEEGVGLGEPFAAHRPGEHLDQVELAPKPVVVGRRACGCRARQVEWEPVLRAGRPPLERRQRADRVDRFVEVSVRDAEADADTRRVADVHHPKLEAPGVEPQGRRGEGAEGRGVEVVDAGEAAPAQGGRAGSGQPVDEGASQRRLRFASHGRRTRPALTRASILSNCSRSSIEQARRSGTS